MTPDTTTALGAMTGARYLESLKDGREVWLDGEKVQDVTSHPAFTGMVRELARIYDLQHTEAYRDQMTFISPATGQRCSLSWLLPRSHDDLKKKRRNSEIWNEQCWGQLGRGPDILAPYIITLYDIRDTLSAVPHAHCDFGENVVVMPWKFLPRRAEIRRDWAWRERWVNSVKCGRLNKSSGSSWRPCVKRTVSRPLPASMGSVNSNFIAGRRSFSRGAAKL
jgi:4-hydroxyphenylacetate 3-hydroxylase N terminal